MHPTTTRWLLLSYRLPREPTRLRLSVWRRLKQVGAAVVHGSLWVLPAGEIAREQFDWLAEEIEEQGGRALIWEGESLGKAQDRDLVRLFRGACDRRYGEIEGAARSLVQWFRRQPVAPATLREARSRLGRLDGALRLARRTEYFRCEGRPAAQRALDRARRLLASAPCSNPSMRGAHALGHSAPLSR